MIRIIAFVIFLCLNTANAQSKISVADRHMIMIQPGIEQVLGSYMFGVKNNSDKEEEIQFEVLLPNETVDFGPQDGLSKEDLVLADNGKLLISKKFKPGLNILSIGFLAKVDPAEGLLTYNAPFDLKELSFITNDKNLTFSSEGLVEGVPPMLRGNNFQGIVSGDIIKKGSKIVLNISGLPQGRKSYIYMGIVFSIVLVIFSVLLTIWKKTSTSYQNDIDEVVEL